MTESDAARIDSSDMRAVHQVFRASLASAPAFVASTDGDKERRANVVNYYFNVIDFLEVHHDGEEHLVFPLLLERAAEQRGLVEGVAGEHIEVHQPMKVVKESLEAWESNGDAEAAQVLRSLQILEAALTPHLDHEEETLLPLASEYLTAQEWGQLPAHGMMNFGG